MGRSMKSLVASRGLFVIGTVAIVGACASFAPADRVEGTAVREAARGAIVGCASNAATHDDAQSQRRNLSPLCSRKS